MQKQMEKAMPISASDRVRRSGGVTSERIALKDQIRINKASIDVLAYVANWTFPIGSIKQRLLRAARDTLTFTNTSDRPRKKVGCPGR